MKFPYVFLGMASVVLAGSLGLARAASATSYSDSFTADPTTFNCGYFTNVEICGGFSLLAAPRILNTGDQVVENITYSTPLNVPGSTANNVAYVGLFDSKVVGGPSLPGPNQNTFSSVVSGYAGPPAPLLGTFNNSSLHAYYGIVGFGFGYGEPNPGFSISGMTTTFGILTGDPDVIVGTDYGYTVALPYTPQVVAETGGSLDHPAILSGEVGKITSEIGGANPGAQFYDFTWNGGLFQALGTVADPSPADNYSFQLYKVAYDGTLTLENFLFLKGPQYSGSLTDTLGTGNYEIGLSTLGIQDPAFSITFNTPVGVSVPEPGTWALMLVGLAGLGAVVRRRNGMALAG